MNKYINTLIVYHRGGGKSLGYPPNCIFTINWALNQKAKGIELDTVVVKDKKSYKMIVIEPKLLLENNFDINNLHWKDMTTLDTGNKHFGLFKVITLKEVLSIVELSQVQLQIHIKGKNIKSVSTLISELKYLKNTIYLKNILITSFDLNILTEVTKLEPKLRVGWIVKPDNKSGSEGTTDLTKEITLNSTNIIGYTNKELIDIRTIAKKNMIDVILLCAPKISQKEIVTKLRKQGFEIGAWGVGCNLVLAKKLVKFGIDRFTLDNPEELQL